MNWNNSMRQIHRWLSIIFTAAVILNVVAMARKQQAIWVGLLALFPLILLLLSGLYLFVLPYLGKRRSPISDRARNESRSATAATTSSP